MTLEKAVAQAYQDLARSNSRYGSLRYRTGLFNSFYRTLADLEGWASTIRLDAHHIIESRMFTQLNTNPAFSSTFEKLGWKSELDLPAVAWETEFHIRTGTSLAKEFEIKGDLALIDAKSLSNILAKEIGDPSTYQSFEQLLRNYEAFYQKPIKIPRPDGTTQTFNPLWPHVRETFVRIRQALGMPPPLP